MNLILMKLGENTIRLIVLKYHENRLSDDIIMTSFLIIVCCFLAKGSNSVAKGNLSTIAHLSMTLSLT